MSTKQFVGKTGEVLKSRVEQRWDAAGAGVLQALYGKEVIWEQYEPFKLHIGNTWYRVDWAYQFEDGSMAFLEVKESEYQSNFRDSRTRVLVASGTFRMFEWLMVLPESAGAWTLRRMEGEQLVDYSCMPVDEIWRIDRWNSRDKVWEIIATPQGRIKEIPRE